MAVAVDHLGRCAPARADCDQDAPTRDPRTPDHGPMIAPGGAALMDRRTFIRVGGSTAGALAVGVFVARDLAALAESAALVNDDVVLEWNEIAVETIGNQPPFVAARSMRDVEPNVVLRVRDPYGNRFTGEDVL